MTLSTQAIEELMWNNIKPPSPGSAKTTCPLCSPTRRKRKEKCAKLEEHNGIVTLSCFHCGHEDAFLIAQNSHSV